VGDEDHRALECGERPHQHLLGVEVEMIRRLVEHEEVRRIVEHEREHEPRLLAAREHAAALVDRVPGKPERARERTEGTERGEWKRELQRLDHARARIEDLHRMLGEVAHLHARADRDRTGIRLGLPGDQAEQGRFSGAVHAHHAPALAAAQQQVEPVVDRPRAVALLHRSEIRDIVARARRRTKLEFDHLPPLRRLDLLDLLELLDA
jgi:hypothetical protein